MINSGLQSTVKLIQIIKESETMQEKQNNAEIKSNVECSKTVFESPFLHNIKIGLGVKLGFKNFFFWGGENFHFVWKIAF